MPFTLCHPAAVVALPAALRRRLPLAAIAVGTMTPDFEYLLRLRPYSAWSHTLPGLLVFCLPVGLLVWIAWEQIARRPTRELLGLRTERAPHPFTTASVALAGTAVLLGAMTHLAWDAFTHSGRLGATLFPQLEHEAGRIGAYSLRWFSVLQHLSTVGGAGVLAVWYVRHHRRYGRTPAGSPRWRMLLAILAMGSVVGIVNAYVPHTFGDARHPGTMLLLGRFVVGGMVGVGVTLLLYSAGQLRMRVT